MRAVRRDYAGPEDLRAIQVFAQRIWSRDSQWHLGDVAWQLGKDPHGRPEWTMALWETHDAVEAWGRVTAPDQVSILVDPERPGLVDEVLEWADGVAVEPPTVTVLDTERLLVRALERRGFVADIGAPFMLAHHRDLASLPPPPVVASGFTVRPVRGEADLARRLAVHREVWHPSTVTEARWRAVTGTWPYRPEFDVAVEDPTGRFVAYCMGWYDEVNRVGELEPVGTVEEFRRRGLSRAATIAVLRAFRDAGGESAVVSARGDDDYPTPKKVYATLGFVAHARTVRYRRPPT